MFILSAPAVHSSGHYSFYPEGVWKCHQKIRIISRAPRMAFFWGVWHLEVGREGIAKWKVIFWSLILGALWSCFCVQRAGDAYHWLAVGLGFPIRFCGGTGGHCLHHCYPGGVPLLK